ncbi:aminoglycoside phosphotransferase family protein [Yoonia maritima]|uniref:aminoglycoside phosphotransferase family protein n=1 Tax=Yoonia maritima TaxID=1435347 RepID=UPI003736C550
MERKTIIDNFIASSDWAAWDRHALAGDASARRYERLTDGTSNVILMDAPPENGETTHAFASITSLLQNAGLAPPEILAHDVSAGIMILSDLGQDDFARWLTQNPSDNLTLYRAATDVLVHLANYPAPSDLNQMTPEIGAQMVEITGEFYANAPTPDLTNEVHRALITLAPNANTLALRDYHAENLIWRPEQQGLNRVGLLDYQDAFIAPAGYDLASLLRDVRREIDPALAQEITTYYMAKTGAGSEFPAQLACLGAQRNLRILGVFARLSLVMGKKRYIDLIPRVWANLMADLRHPELKMLEQAVRDTLPAPDTETLARLRA